MRTKAIQTDLASLNYVASATWNKEEEKRVFTFGPKNLGYWVWHTPERLVLSGGASSGGPVSYRRGLGPQ